MTVPSCEVADGKHPRPLRKGRCCITLVAGFLLLLVIVLILAFTVFKTKQPTTKLVSATVDGITPRVSFPALKIDLNITLNLEILVYNPNHASFKHDPGKSFVFYRGQEFGEVDVSPGRIPATGSETIRCRLTLDADEIGSDLGNLINDVVAGELEIDTQTRLPGRVTFLGIFRKHVVAVSNCQITIGVGDLKILRQDCKNKVKL